ncbi:hypothetical protein QO002_006280 [Pararhizobium capsulatum DSM 1112]|uniref:Uncharacterized protein n=1 Tax=Pararhizobium capsulatum DSM 1112 TaxID=1121113 RepID=A0ABU0BYY2_9HYPH|nr:hypothetical protein [Pararhizobium capsulatum]MDQ0323478.1 hypothetical protein [Pararhizobium capsulatum DSM 1112]MDQ0324073.1 hypothetical protein [Pararhizobium capsulatum DSM 1112]
MPTEFLDRLKFGFFDTDFFWFSRGIALILATDQVRQHTKKGLPMRNVLTVIAAMSASLLSATATTAQTPVPSATDVLVKYGEVEGWTVYENQTRGDCLIVRDYGMGSVQMGVTANQEVGYLGVFTKADIGFQNGTVTEVFVDVGGKLYSGLATSTHGELKGGYSGGYILANDPNFKRDIAKKYEMIVFPKTTATFVVDLKGTYKAMEMGAKCLKH